MTSGAGAPSDTNSIAWLVWRIKQLEDEVQDLKTRLNKAGL